MLVSGKIKHSIFWDTAVLKREKVAVKKELDEYGNKNTNQQKLKYILDIVDELEKHSTPAAYLRRYVFAMSAIVHHERHGGLSKSVLSKLTKLLNAILAVNGVTYGQAKSASLYRDLRVFLSQIHRKEGRHWQAAWEHEYGNYLSPNYRGNDKGFDQLVMANRSMRLGNTAESLKRLSEALIIPDISPNRQARIRIEFVRTLRIIREFDRAEEFITKTIKNISLDENMLREFKWEQLCIGFMRDDDFRPIAKAVDRNGDFYSAEFILEALLWSHAHPAQMYRKKIPKLPTLIRREDFALGRRTTIFVIVNAIEQCYESNIPSEVRLENLGQALQEIDKLFMIDHVLLAWLAAARVLARKRSYTLASLALNEYLNLYAYPKSAA